MNISFDALPLISENMSGIGYCEAGLAGEMIRSHPEDSFTFDYFSRKDHEVKRNRLKAYMQKNVTLNEACFSGFTEEEKDAFRILAKRISNNIDDFLEDKL